MFISILQTSFSIVKFSLVLSCKHINICRVYKDLYFYLIINFVTKKELINYLINEFINVTFFTFFTFLE